MTSFFWSLNDAKLKSAATWPLDESIADMRSALADIDVILASRDRLKLQITARETESVLTSYRINKLNDLTLALEILNQRALASEHLSETDIAQWGFWLDETRAILSAVYETGVVSGLADSSAWRASKAAFDKNPSLGFDATVSAALSLVLKHTQTDTPNRIDCTAARGLINFASAEIKDDTYIHTVIPRFEDPAPTRGLVTQIENRIAAECGS